MNSYLKSKHTFLSSNGKQEVTYYVYTPKDTIPRGVVQLSHGMTEYVERYEDFAEFLCKYGFVFCGNDHLGHGNTARTADDYGYFSEGRGLQYLCRDVRRLTLLMKKQYRHLPYFLLGHSMGSFIARAYTIRYKNAIDGLILSGSGEATPAVHIGVRIADDIIKRKGPRYRSNLFKDLVYRSYRTPLNENQTAFDWLSRDPQIVRDYTADEKCTFLFTSSAVKELFLMLNYVSSRNWYRKFPKQLPVYIFSGDRDPVGQYGLAVKAIEKKLREQQVKDVTVNLYAGARHEILNEINREEVYRDLLHWLLAHPPLRTHPSPANSLGIYQDARQLR